MAASPVKIYPIANSVVRSAAGVIAVYAGAGRAAIVNPSTAADQGTSAVEVLFYSYEGPCGIAETATTFALQPGQRLDIAANSTKNLWVNATTVGHKFAGFIAQPPTPFPPTPVPQTFPPAGPTSLQLTIRSYLYEQYKDDDNLQASRRAYNELMQAYVDWFNQFSLGFYTADVISGTLLDWVGLGLYGVARPVLSSGQNPDEGPYNTFMFNELAFNELRAEGASDVTVTSDDIYKRILTWRLYRGDGKTFNMLWLKRRCKRFLFGVNGTDIPIDNTYEISASYAANRQINIVLPPVENATILKEAIDTGTLDLPFQYTFSVTIS